MRTLFVTFDPPENIGGVENRVLGYVREFGRRGHYLQIDSFSPAFGFATKDFDGVKLNSCPSSLRKLPLSLKFAIRQLKSFRLDSIFLLSGGITVFGAAILLYCRLTKRNSAMLLYGKDLLQARRSTLGQIVLAVSLRLTNRVLVNSRFTSSLVPSVSWKTDVLYPGIDPSLYTNAGSRQGSGKTILFVGRLIKRKGLNDLIDAFDIVAREIDGVTLEIVGDGPERSQAEHLVADLSLGGRVAFLGTLRGESLYQKFASCDVFAMPSVRLADDVEGFGTVFLEAALFGKPSVGTFSGGIPEAVEDGKSGILVREGHVDELAMSLRRLLTNQRVADSMGRYARERVLRRFTWAESTNQLIRSLKGNRPR